MLIKYSKIYYEVFLKILSGRYTEKDKRKFDLLCSWLMMESEKNEW